MKKQIKNLIAILLIIISLTSCKQGIKKETIETCKSENGFYAKDLEDKVSVQEQMVKETEGNYNDFLKEIDPKQQKNFNKDALLQAEITNKKACIEELALGFKSNNDRIKLAIGTNNLFIASLENSDLKELDAEKQWNAHKDRMQKLQTRGDSISTQVTNIKADTYELFSSMITKYGVHKKDPHKKNAKKK